MRGESPSNESRCDTFQGGSLLPKDRTSRKRVTKNPWFEYPIDSDHNPSRCGLVAITDELDGSILVDGGGAPTGGGLVVRPDCPR